MESSSLWYEFSDIYFFLYLKTKMLNLSDLQGVCKLNVEKPYRRLDIRLAPHDQYYCAILYFTGSDMFNKEMRTHALEKKYTLNEYTLKKLTLEGITIKSILFSIQNKNLI